MNWLIFAILAYLALALEVGLGSLLHIGYVTPSFLLILAAFIGISAPPSTVMWSFLVIGLLGDLTHPYATADGITDMVLIGPTAIGYLFAAYAILQTRGMFYRESTTTLAVMVGVAGVCMNLGAVALLSFRGLPLLTAEPPPGFFAADELVRRFWQLLYTGALAVPIGFVLWRLEPIFGFDYAKGHHSRGRL
jgi:hypothetical protein